MPRNEALKEKITTLRNTMLLLLATTIGILGGIAKILMVQINIWVFSGAVSAGVLIIIITLIFFKMKEYEDELENL